MTDLRHAIAKTLSATTRDYNLAANDVMALPEMQARERVIEAARAWKRATYSTKEAYEQGRDAFWAAVVALEAK